MKIKILQTKVDEDTFVPTLVLSVEVDVEELSNLIRTEGQEEAATQIGYLFMDKLDAVI